MSISSVSMGLRGSEAESIILGMSDKKLSVAIAYRGIPHARGWATGDNLVRAFKRLGHRVYPYGNYHQTQERLNKQPLPKELDLLIYCECNDFDPQYEELRHQKARARVYWDFDVDNGREGAAAELAKQIDFDLICHANKLYADYFKQFAPKTLFLPYAFDDEHFKPLKIKPQIKVAIIGTPYSQRRRYVKKLQNLGAHVDFIQGVYQDEFVKALNNLKIHLNLNIFGPGGNGLLVMRVWETVGCSTFLLTQRKDFIEDFFEDGKHLALFESEAECADKIKYYLEHEVDREKIANAGHKEALRNHTYLSRSQTIIDNTNQLIASQKPRTGHSSFVGRLKFHAKSIVSQN
jgi:hypothetical protein